MIEVDRLTKYYGPVPAVQDVSFAVEKGQIVGFLGPNGAGKTTTMRILSCFMPASSGTARVAGYDVFEQSLEVRRRIGYLPENVPLYGDMTVAAYLDFVADVKGVGRGERRRRVGEVLERCQIPDVRERLIARLSKGYRQRVGLAQALIGDPEVLILDEPTIGLDPKQIVGIRQLIKSLAGAHTVILSTHILPEVSMVCEGVVIINRGRIVASGPLDRLMQELSPVARVQVQIEGPPELVGQSLRALRGVQRVESRGVAGGVGHLRPGDGSRARRAAGRRPAGRAAALGAPRAAGPRALARGHVHPRGGRRGARGGDGRRTRRAAEEVAG